MMEKRDKMIENVMEKSDKMSEKVTKSHQELCLNETVNAKFISFDTDFPHFECKFLRKFSCRVDCVCCSLRKRFVVIST